MSKTYLGQKMKKMRGEETRTVDPALLGIVAKNVVASKKSGRNEPLFFTLARSLAEFVAGKDS